MIGLIPTSSAGYKIFCFVAILMVMSTTICKQIILLYRVRIGIGKIHENPKNHPDFNILTLFNIYPL